MAVSSVTVIGTVSANITAQGDRVYEVEYQVETDTASDQAITASTASGLPSARTYYAVGNDYDTGAFARSWRPALVNRTGNRKLWQVMVQFSSAGNNVSPSEAPQLYGWDKPWERPARVRMMGHEEEVSINSTGYYKNDSNSGSFQYSFQNSAEDDHPDPIATKFSYPTLIIEKDYDTMPTWESLVDSTNDSLFFGQAAGWWRMSYPTIEKLYTGEGLRYFNITWEFVRADSQFEAWDKGFWVFLDDVTRRRSIASDDYNHSAPHPIMLDGAGYPLEAGGTKTLLVGYRYLQQSWTGLNIPTSWTDDRN